MALIPAPVGFCAEQSDTTADDHGPPAAEYTLEKLATDELNETIELFAKARPVMPGVYQSNRHTFAEEIRQQFQISNEATPRSRVHVLNVSGDHPDEVLGGTRACMNSLATRHARWLSIQPSEFTALAESPTIRLACPGQAGNDTTSNSAKRTYYRRMNDLLLKVAAKPWLRWPLWMLYAIMFYNAGLAITTLLIEPEAFAGGRQWLWAAAFPVLLIGFFKLNRYLGCAGGSCAVGRPRAKGYTAPPGH